MHVALCTDGVFPQALGGMQRHSRLLATHLAASGQVKLSVVHPHDEGIFNPAEGIDEVPVQPIDTGRFYLGELWRYSDRVAQALHRLQPDVVLSQGFSVWKGMQRFSPRLIVHPHGLEMFQGLTAKERLMGTPFRMLVRHVARNSRVVISLGGRLTPLLEEVVAESPARVQVIPNAVDLPPQEGYAPVKGPLQFLFVGRFAFNKGLDVLLAVARQLAAQGVEDVQFLLAGDGPLLHQLQKELPPNVQLLGRVGDNELFALYRQCAALVLPTRFEGMPTVVLEAMARSRPVLVSDVGATAELVDATNGYLLPAGDAGALLQAVLAFRALSPMQRAAMGERSRERCAARFGWPSVTEQFIGLFRSVARSG